MIVLAIESSCDETSIAICSDNPDVLKRIIALKTYSQIAEHSAYGGVVPEIAARNHLAKITSLTKAALDESGLSLNDITKIAVTTSPGLIGALIVGISFAKGLAISLNKPLVNVNHLDGHIFTTYLTNNLYKEYYCLLISGGHCQTITVNNFYDKKIYGTTIDDSVGEAFDKLAKLLGLGYPGGAKIEKLALNGNQKAFSFKIPMIKTDDFNFSFSGLKTHFLNIVAKQVKEHLNIAPDELKYHKDLHSKLPSCFIADLCASFQSIVSDILINRCEHMILSHGKTFGTLVISGGVAANKYIKQRFISEIGEKHGIEIITPPLYLCTDNAAMIAAASIVADIREATDERGLTGN